MAPQNENENADSDPGGGLLSVHLYIPANTMPLLSIDLQNGNSTASDRSAELGETPGVGAGGTGGSEERDESVSQQKAEFYRVALD